MISKSVVFSCQCLLCKSLTSRVLGSRQLQDGQPQPSSIPSSAQWMSTIQMLHSSQLISTGSLDTYKMAKIGWGQQPTMWCFPTLLLSSSDPLLSYHEWYKTQKDRNKNYNADVTNQQGQLVSVIHGNTASCPPNCGAAAGVYCLPSQMWDGPQLSNYRNKPSKYVSLTSALLILATHHHN